MEKESYISSSPKQIEFNGKLIWLDTLYASTSRGILKVVAIALCFLSIVLVCASQPVGDERGPALSACFLAIVGSFAILLEYTFMFHTRLTSTCAFIIEATFYCMCAVGLFISAILMWLFSVSHWTDLNPDWAIMPSLATGSLFASAIVYIVEVALLVSYFRRFSWRPPSEFEQRPSNTVLPPY